MPYCFLGSSIKFQGHEGWKIDKFNPIWVRLLGWSQLSNPSDLPCYWRNNAWNHSTMKQLCFLKWDLTDDKSTLLQVMAWCRQTTSHYLIQFWPWFISQNGITRPQCVKPSVWYFCHTLPPGKLEMILWGLSQSRMHSLTTMNVCKESRIISAPQMVLMEVSHLNLEEMVCCLRDCVPDNPWMILDGT